MDRKNIIKKLFNVQNKNLVFKKEEDNPFFHSKYVTLDALNIGLLPVLKEEGLLISHATSNREVITNVCDTESGECVQSAFPIPEGLDPQKMGSAITYAKRYNIGQLFNIVTDEDDDGNKASAKKNAKKGVVERDDDPLADDVIVD